MTGSGIPVRLVGSNRDGTHEELIGDFQGGTVLRGVTLTDVITQRPIANLTRLPGKNPQVDPTALVWEVPHLKKYFVYIFTQVMPEDGSAVIDLPGIGKKEFF